jgi:hypothetical protein
VKKLNDLPKNDEWDEGAEKYIAHPIVFQVCPTHTKETWKDHVGYIDNKDGTASCEKCNWGFRVPGHMRIYNKRVVDLRDR